MRVGGRTPDRVVKRQDNRTHWGGGQEIKLKMNERTGLWSEHKILPRRS